MAEVGARDRLVMAGLVILGLLTVVAGILSGRSTLNYVLARDAREASLSWAGSVNSNLGELGPHAPQFLDQSLDVLNPEAFASQSGQPASLPATSTAKDDFPLVAELGRLTGWALSHISKDEFVSKLKGFAVLGPDLAPLAVGGEMPADALKGLLAQDDSKQALDEAVHNDAVVTAAMPGDDHLRLAFVPATENGKVARVYAFAVDQSAAAALTNLALTVVTLTTSLLIVMGFSVPAAIASRRIRERWLAEDQIRYLAMHDSLTGLPNRLQLHQHLDRAVARAKRHGQLMAVLLSRPRPLQGCQRHARPRHRRRAARRGLGAAQGEHARIRSGRPTGRRRVRHRRRRPRSTRGCHAPRAPRLHVARRAVSCQRP